MKLLRLSTLILAIFFALILLTGCEANNGESGQSSQNGEIKEQEHSTDVKDESSAIAEMNLTDIEKEKWLKYFNSLQLQFLPIFSSAEPLDEKAVLMHATFYAFSQGTEKKVGYKVETAMWDKIGYKVTRIKTRYVEQAAKYLFDRQVQNQSTDFFAYDNGYYWVKPVGLETTPIYRIKKAIDNKNNTYSFDVYFYENLYLSGAVYHTEDGKELSREEFNKLILDSNAKIAEKPVRASKLTIKKVGNTEQYVIVENVKVTEK